MEQIFQVFLIAFLVFVNGFFVAAEFAIVKIRPSKIDQLVSEGYIRARVARKILNNLDAYLSACQVGITFASLGLGWVGEPFVADQLEPFFKFMGIESEALLNSLAFGIAFGLITYLHIVVGEMAPKSLSIRLAEKTTLWVAIPLHLFYKIFIPFIYVLNESALFILKTFGISKETEVDLPRSQEELKHLLLHLSKIGQLTRREAEIMENVLALRHKTAKQIMIPRTAVAYLSTTNTFTENLRIIEENQHTRYPLCEGDLDHVLGMVHVKDIFTATIEGKKGVRMIDLKRDVLFYPETIDLETLFKEFQRTKLHMAVLIDEYGGTTGIVTLEDVLEELVGEIYDEFDKPTTYIRQVGKKEYLLDGMCPVRLCEEKLNVHFPEFDVETVGGLVFNMVGRIPEPGQKVKFDQGTFIVEAIDRQRIAKIRMIIENNRNEHLNSGDNNE